MKIINQKNDFIEKIENLKKNHKVNVRKIVKSKFEIYILNMKEISDRDKISRDIIKPILQYNNKRSITIKELAETIIFNDVITLENDFDNLLNYILKGNTIISIPGYKQYIVCNTLNVAKRSVTTPEIQSTLRGPRDSFTENLQSNLSLIRYRIKDSSLKVKNISMGVRSKTSVAIIYVDDIVNSRLIDNVEKKLKSEIVDGVFESGYIQKLLDENRTKLFPGIGIIERSDTAATSLMKGKVCILVEGSNLGLIIPRTFFDFLDAGDDHYDNMYIAASYKIIRFLSLGITLTLSAIYVMLVSFHPDILPSQYILSLAISRVTVPANALVEAVVMEGVAEILREASIRLPTQIGPAIGIVGTIVIGQAAVAAELVSPLMVIVVSLVTMASFVVPDFTIMNPIRLLKYFIIFITGVFGLFGFVMGLTVIFINLTSIKSFGVSYFSPVAPFVYKDLKNYLLGDIWFAKIRPKILKNKDKTRQ